jgi:hypothetical protein
MKGVLVAVVEYLLGFFALAVFASYAFAAGAPTDERWIAAFKLGGSLALVELTVLLFRQAPANRLILAANLWLVIAAGAAFLEQWWVLLLYQKFGEASLFAAMLTVGVTAMLVSPSGFVAATGKRRDVLLASGVLALAVAAALCAAVVFRGDVKLAAIAPVIALAWLNRGLRSAVRRGASQEAATQA